MPKICLADDFDNITLKKIEKYLGLPEPKVEELLRSLVNLFNSEWINLEASGRSTAEERVVPNIMRGATRAQALNHLLVDVPIEITWGIIKGAIEIARIYFDPSVVLEKLEKLSVEKAIEEGKRQLFQDEIRVTPGAIEFKYTSQKGEKKVALFQYIIIYQPIDNKNGKILIRFYSPNPLEPPERKGSIGNTLGIYHELDRNLPPFVVDIRGAVENYQWVGNPSMKIDFPPVVPDLGIKLLSRWEKYLLKPIETTIKEVEIVITKVTGKSLGLTDIWEKVKSFISEIAAFAPAALVQTPSVKGEQTLGDKISEPLTVKETIKEVVEVRPQQLPQPPEQKLTTKDIQEILDDISERIDVINQGVVKLTGVEVKPQQESQKEIKEETKEKEIEKGKIEPEEKVSFCAINQTAIPQRNKAIINEIAWMGGTNSANDEWIELKNISGQEINLTGWQLLDKDQQIKILFPKGAKLLFNGFLLLERTNDDSAPEAAADFIYTGALSNTNEALYLFDGNCQLQDEVLAEPNWPAGDNTSKRTTERKPDLAWQTSSNAGGTPKMGNSSGYAEIFSGGGGGGGVSVSSSSSSPPLVKILISEIQVDSQKGADDEFVELYNPNNQEVSLEKWSIQRAASSDVISKKNFESGNIIPAKGYFLIVDKYASQDLLNLAGMSHNSFDLTQGNTIFLVSNQEKISSGEEETIIDKVGYWTAFSPEGGISAPGPISGQSVGRKWDEVAQAYPDTNNNSRDFEIQIPTPKAKNQSPVKDTTPPIAQAGPDQTVEINQPITLDGSGSNDNLGITSFKWDINQDNQWDFDGRTIILKEGFSEIGERLIILQVADEAGNTATDTLIITVVSPPKILISEIQIDTTYDFVELYNPNNFEIDIYSFQLKKRASTGSETSIRVFPSGSKILAQNYFLWANSDYALSGLISPDTTSTQTLAKNNSLAFFGKNRNLIDAVAWGSSANPFVEGSPFPKNPEKNQTLGRKWSTSTQNYIDTDNNFEDFEIQIPTPKEKNKRDLIPPETEIISKPPSLTNQTTATFRFSSNEESSTFQCKIDSEPLGICSSPAPYSSLSDGPHTFYVKAIDSAGNEDPTPAEHTWTIDTTIESPSLSLIDLDSNSTSYTNERMVKVEISQGKEAAAWFLSENGQKPATNTVDWLDTKPANFTLSAGNGNKIVYIWTKDAAENISQLGNSASIILDTVLPETNLGEAPASFDNQSPVIFTFSSNEKKSTFECKINERNWQDCNSPQIFSDLQEGENTFLVRAKDLALNLDSSPSQHIWTVDTIPPVSQVAPLEPSQSSLKFLVDWSGTDLGSGILTHALQSKDGAAGEWQNWQETVLKLSAEFIGQDEHTYYFRSRAEDKAGNQELWTDEADAFTKIEIPKDVIPPAAISDLSAETGANPGEIKLTWLAPGDNGNEGQALDYAIKYFSEEITEGKWASSTIVSNPPLPKEAGNLESFVVSGLSSNTIYYFAVKTRDDSQNVSLISNSSFAETPSAVLETSPTQMIFLVEYGESSPPVQCLTIRNTGLAGASWSIFSNSNWLSATPNSGVLPANNSSQLTISLDVSDLELGVHNASLIIEAPNAKNSPKEISVLLNLKDTTPPIANAGPDQTVEKNQPINFDASGSSDNVEIVSFKWDIDSSNGLDWNNPDLTGKNPVFQGYPEVKSYSVTLHVSDASGNMATDSLAVTVVESQPTLEIVINEIAWMGTRASYTDEWMELYNNTNQNINLAGWRLKAADGIPQIELTGTILAKGYYLLERTNNNVIFDISADLIYTEVLANEGERLELRDAGGKLIDLVDALSDWFAGDNTNKISMERINSLSSGSNVSNWANNNLITRNGKDAGQNKINGTPRAKNSVSISPTKIFSLPFNEFLEITLTYLGSPYLIEGSIEVLSGKKLKIEPGVIMKFKHTDYWHSELKVEGELEALGEDNKKIVFTSYFDDEYGGDTNQDANWTHPLSGDWEWIYIKNATSTMKNVILRYAGKKEGGFGSPPFTRGALKVENSSINFEKIKLEKSQTLGLWLENSIGQIKDSEFLELTGAGEWEKPTAILIRGGETEIKNSIFKNNKFGISIEGRAKFLIEGNNFEFNEIPIQTASLLGKFSNNLAQRNSLNGILFNSAGFSPEINLVTLKKSNLPFVIKNNFEIPAGYSLNIEPGAIIKLLNSSIFVGGNLIAQGNETEKIVFTSLRDDDFGGDTNGDLSLNPPLAGDWEKIQFNSTSSISVLDGVRIRYGGGICYAGFCRGAITQSKDVEIEIKNSIIKNNKWGIVSYEESCGKALAKIHIDDFEKTFSGNEINIRLDRYEICK